MNDSEAKISLLREDGEELSKKKKRRKKSKEVPLRALGDVTNDLELIMFELVHEHKLQAHEVIGIIYMWIQVHYPDALEVYEDGTNPLLTYTHI